MESELWPNMLCAVREAGIPALLLNARLSGQSFRSWSRVKNTAAEILSTFDLILAQSETAAERFKALGAKNVKTSGNIKYSAAPLPSDALALSGLRLTLGNRKLWVYASSHAGEEALACRIHKTLKSEGLHDLLTIIVPRHPERRRDIAGVCLEQGVKFCLRSNNTALPTPDDDVYVADTLGELGLFYTLSDIGMIGRSFSDDGGGGHNPIEAAQLGCAVLTGPNNQYQKELYADMRAENAVIETKNERELKDALKRLLTDQKYLKQQQENALRFAQSKKDVVHGVLKQIMPYIDDGREHIDAA
jgi:3-deoxy-D-manno-octulosonic-acid transferase